MPGAPSVGLGLGAQRARELRNPLLRATLLFWARESPERVLLESGGGAGRGGARTPMGSCQHQQVLWSKPGARLSSTALPSLRLLGPVDRTRFTHRGETEAQWSRLVYLQRSPPQESVWGVWKT